MIRVLLFWLPLVAAAQPQVKWQAIGQVGGPTQAVAVQGRYAYVGVGLRMVILDVSNPSDIREAGVTRPFPYFVEDIAVQDALAYVAAGAGGLRVVDVSNPALPVEIGAWESPGYAGGVALAGKILYLADGSYGLRVIDVSNPAQPVEIGSAYAMSYAFQVAVDGRYAYIASAGAGLSIADVSDPKHPLEVGSLATTGFAYGVAVAGDTAFVADGWEGLKTVNVADRAHPRQAGAYKTPGWAFGVTVSGTTAYVADGFRGLRVLDVSDPAGPVELQSIEMPGGHAGRVRVDGGAAYVADRNFGLRAVSLSTDSGPAQVGVYQPLAYADSVAVSGNYAYIAAGGWGFAVVDISDPSRPRQVASLPIDGISRDIAVSGDHAYISTMGAGTANLQVIDISDPGHPVKAGLYDLWPGQGRGLDVVDGIAYIANEHGLDLVSVADPRHPVRLAFLRFEDGSVGVIADGKLAYVATGTGLIIVDVSDPSRPLQLGDTKTGMNQAWDIALAGNRVYIADHGVGLHVVDVSDPAHPAVLGAVRVPLAEGVSVAGNLAYVAGGDGGLEVVDVSDPSRPTVVGSLETQGYARQVVAADDRVYLADGLNGLLIIERAGGGAGKSAQARLAGSRPMVAPPAIAEVAQGKPRSGQRRAGNGREVASGCVVRSVADSGAGTLRECITKGEGGVNITFDASVFPPSEPATIRLASPLPPLRWGNTTIDGSDAGVVTDGSGYSQRGAGITLRSDWNAIKGLQILGFSDNAIMIQGDHNVIGGDRSKGRGPLGEGNLVSGNGGSGISISGADNVIIGNLVGADRSGTKALGNGYIGVFVTGGVNNRIGGPDPRDRNIVSGNTGNGISINGPGAGNLVIGNYVGTDITGTIGLGNTNHGITIELGGFNNVVQGNVSSGNRGSGVVISDTGSSYNAVIGNRIGTDAAGVKAIPNDQGVNAGFHEASFNRIGGMRPEERNLISGNGMALNVQATGNLVRGNYIGTDITGRQALTPIRGGLSVGNGTRAFVEGNVIGGNGSAGINVSSSYGYFGGNFIGADASGQTAIPNNGFGVMVTGRHNVFQTNVIANNRSGGIGIDPLSYNTIRRDWIYGNAAKGIQYSSGGAGGLGAPVLTTAGATAVSGTACADCEVEIFSDAGGQGRIFEGSTPADASGNFRFDKRSPLAGPNVTATATDRRGNTSEFSAPRAVPRP